MNGDNNSFSSRDREPLNENVNAVNYGEEKIKKPSKLPGIILTAAAVILAALIFFIVNKSYTVSNVIINGSAPYPIEDLEAFARDYCKSKNAGSFFYVDEEELTEKYYGEFPYLKSVKVEKHSPDTVIVTVEGEEALAYFYMIDSYYIINESMKVLEKVSERPASPTLIEVTVATPKEIAVGRQLVFGEGIAVDAETFVKLYGAIAESELRYDVVSISAKSKFEIAMKLRSGTDVKVGSIKDVEDKISGLKKWMDENPSMLGPKVNIDITIIKKISITYD